MMVDALSVALRALSFVALFQAAGISLFLVLFGRLVVASDPTLRRAATLSALVAMGVLVSEYVLEAARMSGDFSGPPPGRTQRPARPSRPALTKWQRVAKWSPMRPRDGQKALEIEKFPPPETGRRN